MVRFHRTRSCDQNSMDPNQAKITFTATQGFDMREFTVVDNGIRYDAGFRKGYGQTCSVMEHWLRTRADLVIDKKTECHRVKLFAGSKIGNGARIHFSIGARELDA